MQMHSIRQILVVTLLLAIALVGGSGSVAAAETATDADDDCLDGCLDDGSDVGVMPGDNVQAPDWAGEGPVDEVTRTLKTNGAQVRFTDEFDTFLKAKKAFSPDSNDA